MSDTGTDAGADTESGYLAATRTAYDTVAASYADLLSDHLAGNPFDRAALALFAELVRSTAEGRAPAVTEVGCGPGRITAHLAGLGLDASGIDLSPGMVAEAARRHPGIAFALGSMTDLDLPEGRLDGLVAWYSVIHVPPAEHAAVYAGFRRVLKPGGHLLLAFHVGSEKREITDAYGHSGLRYDAYRLQPDAVDRDLAAAGFEPVARHTHAPLADERSAQAYVIARTPRP